MRGLEVAAPPACADTPTLPCAAPLARGALTLIPLPGVIVEVSAREVQPHTTHSIPSFAPGRRGKRRRDPGSRRTGGRR